MENFNIFELFQHSEDDEMGTEYKLRFLQKNNNSKIADKLRNKIRVALKRKNSKKAYTVMELIGCTISELKNHLESTFQDGMTWDNYGEWHIDHIKPCSSFNLENVEEQKKCFHYTNLQALWAIDNRKKSDKLDWVNNEEL